MPLAYEDWITELENAIVAHIDHYVDIDVQIISAEEGELPRAFTKPVITIGEFDSDRRHSGGMNVVGTKEQAYWQMPSYYITVTTDDGDYHDNGSIGRNRVAALLDTVAFGQQLHLLKTATGATVVNLRPIGPTLSGGPTADRTVYQRAFILDIEVLVPFTSVVI